MARKDTQQEPNMYFEGFNICNACIVMNITNMVAKHTRRVMNMMNSKKSTVALFFMPRFKLTTIFLFCETTKKIMDPLQ